MKTKYVEKVVTLVNKNRFSTNVVGPLYFDLYTSKSKSIETRTDVSHKRENTFIKNYIVKYYFP